MKFTIGSDFEVPIINTVTGDYISAIGLIGGTKANPIPIGEGCYRQEDNVAAEFNIPIVKTKEDFKKYIQYCIDYGNTFLKGINEDYELDIVSSAMYNDNQLQDDAAKQFGCAPSLNARLKKTTYNPSFDEIGNLRTFGFHIHVGSKELVDNLSEIERLVLRMDDVLGSLNQTIGIDTQRQKYYGMPGEFRIKPYGFEYRVLGSELLNNLDEVWEATLVSLEVKELVNA